MSERTLQLVLHYDGAAFAGWQRQPDSRTVQGVLEQALRRLCDRPVQALGSGRTDAGAHARGQAVGVRVPATWPAPKLRRALNAVLPDDMWVVAAHEMRELFHARFSAIARRYSYVIGTDEGAASPFRRRWEWVYVKPLDRAVLDAGAASLVGNNCFRAFAVRGTAPETDDHRCQVTSAVWRDRPGGVVFEIEANRFLHHMVRFLVGTMIDSAAGRRDAADLSALLAATDSGGASAPAPAHALCLERVCYPSDLYLFPA
ncbi:MAG: tRNA pseudouridine(38-40) synthase TruA [Gemmatimonadota bacterium]|nr:tRNA pseudouridine(38-40) synthase TruA [Gemmatimonadota bacterium]